MRGLLDSPFSAALQVAASERHWLVVTQWWLSHPTNLPRRANQERENKGRLFPVQLIELVWLEQGGLKYLCISEESAIALEEFEDEVRAHTNL
jgi:hypothetical protein